MWWYCIVLMSNQILVFAHVHSGFLLSQFTVMAASESTMHWLNKLKFKNVSKFFINNTIISRLSMIVWVIESWIGLLLLTVTDVSTTCAVVIFRQSELYHISWWY